MQHTQCGITRIQDNPELLAPYFQITEDELPGMAIGDPRAAVEETLSNPLARVSFGVSLMVCLSSGLSGTAGYGPGNQTGPTSIPQLAEETGFSHAGSPCATPAAPRGSPRLPAARSPTSRPGPILWNSRPDSLTPTG